jgi:hypothetical protein
VMVADLWPGVSSGAPQGIRAAGAKLFFSAHSPAVGRELWVMDLPAPAAASHALAATDKRTKAAAGGGVSGDGGQARG